MRALSALLLALALAAPAAPQGRPAEPPARALALELTALPRLAGTSASRRAVELVQRELEAAGFEVEIDAREVLLSLPRRLEVAFFQDILAKEPYHERIESFDPAATPAGDIPPFNAWSASAEVRGPVVDAGYGTREDFERLVAAGADLAGSIALCRYGQGYRGIKADLAAQYGCAGVLLFSDPADDGAERGATWPEGPWKPGWAAQRGSISPMGRAPGDPSTPGFASPAPGGREAGERLEGEALDAALPSLPCLPIGADEAAALLERLALRRVEDAAGEVRGRKVGPGPAEVRLLVDAPRELAVVRNVLGRLAGRREGLVVLGNHRDAWVRGAHDAGSGTVALLRAAAHLAESVRGGWRPEHGIVLAFWDAEEFGLIGSTEWAEAHAEELRAKAFAYVNADAAVAGTRLSVSGSPGLEAALSRALARVPAPASGDGLEPLTLLAQWKADADGAPRLEMPGSGSDFTVFLHHLSIPVLDVALRGNSGGHYHTAFDDFAVMDRFLDPGFVGHETAGRLLAALAEELSALGPLALDDAWSAHDLSLSARAAAPWLGEERAAELAATFDSLSRAVSLSWSRWASERGLAGPGGVLSDFGRWPGLLATLDGNAAARREALDAFEDASMPARFYTALASADGLPERPWFKNRLWAPGVELGYGSETFPELRAAAARGEPALEAATDELVRAVRELRAAWEARTSSFD